MIKRVRQSEELTRERQSRQTAAKTLQQPSFRKLHRALRFAERRLGSREKVRDRCFGDKTTNAGFLGISPQPPKD